MAAAIPTTAFLGAGLFIFGWGILLFIFGVIRAGVRGALEGRKNR
jgi:hypothetical protein